MCPNRVSDALTEDDRGRRPHGAGVLGVSAVIAISLVLAVAVAAAGWLLARPGAGAAPAPVQAERIDVTGTLVPIRTVGSFGPAPAPATDAAAAPGQLTSSAAGDRTVAAVLSDLQRFWSAALSARGGPGLKTPAGGYVSMDSSAAKGSALCIGDPSFMAGNAFYCADGDGIVFDSSALVPVLLGAYGSAGLAISFAHEFGHAVQAQVGPTPADRQRDPDRYPAILIEAQADCDAGAFLAWAASGAAPHVHIPETSLVRAVAPLLDFRDPATLQPDAPTAHGLGLDRLSFALTGFREGAAACPAMTLDDLRLTLGRSGVTSSPPSTLPRYRSTAETVAAADTSVRAFARRTLPAGDLPAAATVPDPADLARAAPLGQFAAGAAVALAAGRSATGTASGATCFTGAWTASVFGRAAADQLGSWPTDADEALDLIRSRPGASFDELAGYADGFDRGWKACR